MTIEAKYRKKQGTNFSFMNKYFLCKFVGYFDGEIKKFHLDEQNNLSLLRIEEEETAPSILIVARKKYTEVSQVFPIINKKELTKILNIENNQNNQKYYIWGENNNGQTEVNIWTFYDDVPSSFILLPESLLYALTIDSDCLLHISNASTLFVAKKGKLVYSCEKSVLINSSQRFILSSELPQNIKETKVSADDMYNRLFLGLKKVKVSLLFNFVKKVKSNDLGRWFANLLIPSLFVFFSYLAGSSFYLTIKQNQLDSSVEQQKQKINKILNQQQLLDKQVGRYNALTSFLKTQHSSVTLWLLVISLSPDTNVTNIRTVNGRYVIRGTASKATDVLAKIAKFNGVNNAKFDFPTRNSKGLEIFVIGFTLNTVELENKSNIK